MLVTLSLLVVPKHSVFAFCGPWGTFWKKKVGARSCEHRAQCPVQGVHDHQVLGQLKGRKAMGRA